MTLEVSSQPIATRDIQIEPFTPLHLEGAVHLSQQVSWPHRFEDWALTLSVSKGVVALCDGVIVGTALCTIFGPVASLNMIIVDAQMRGQGLGRKLMDRIIALTGDPELRLVATTDGIPLYEKLGFVAAGQIVQHQGIARKVAPIQPVEKVTAENLPRLAALDADASGMERLALLQAIAALPDGQSEIFVTDAGFAMKRQFGRGTVIGPVVADTDTAARSLIAAIANQVQGQFLRIDLPVQRGLGEFVETLGLANAGGGTAMVMRAAQHPETHMKTYALISQALG
ncbi:MAG: GNAT family N-acetyltransferase [Sedimentitalea sp.]|uniref:GNAT family N-acetyltransferase n=1 Tax=Sedimentitalea sp. TaxID=2048915 RepID=UPI003264FC57